MTANKHASVLNNGANQAVNLEWNVKFARISALSTSVEQALAYKALGLSPVPLRPADKLPTIKAHPALSVVRLTDEEIQQLFCKPGVCVGMVGGYDGWFAIDNDAEDLVQCAEIERTQCRWLSVPYARWTGRKGYKALYQDKREAKPSKALESAANAYLNCGFRLTDVERQHGKASNEATKLKARFDELHAAFDELLNRHIDGAGLVQSAGAPIEVKSFRLFVVLPPSIHPETGKAYRVTPIDLGIHAASLGADGLPFSIDAGDVRAFLDDLRPAEKKARAIGQRAGHRAGKAVYKDYTRAMHTPGWRAITLDEVLRAKPDLATFDDAKWLEASDDKDDRSPAVASLMGKLLQGMMQARKCDADKLGGFHDVAKQLAQIAEDFIDRFPDQTAQIEGSIEDHLKPRREKLGYEAGRAIESALASDFRLYIPGREAKPEGAPIIHIRAGELHIQVEHAMQHLIDAGAPIYVRGGKLVRPILEEVKDALGKPTKAAAFAEIDTAYMRHTLNSHIVWMKYDGRSKEWVPVNAPSDVAVTLLSLRGEWKFKPVTGAIAAPTLRPDGSLLDRTGYDETTGLYLLNSVELPPISEKPTKAEAATALKRIRRLYREFPFVDDASESVAVSMLLTTAARGMTDAVPAHGARAPAAGSGKSYLADIVSAVVSGHRCPVISAGPNSEETEKRIGAKAMTGGIIIAIDNVNGDLGGDMLCQLIERPICEIRVLGRSEMVKIANRATFFFNGNNCRVEGDMTRRVLMADLDHGMERPSEKKFQGDPVAEVLANRGRYLADCLTIVRAYVVAGRPKVVDTPMNSFEAWTYSVRSALVWLGMTDPCETVKIVRQEDPETQQLATFLTAAAKVMGTGWERRWTAADIAMQTEPALHDALDDIAGHNGAINRKKLGKWLSRKRNRIIGKLDIYGQENKQTKVWEWSIRVNDQDGEVAEGSQ
jgi:putative DNA primase/helicase